MVCLYGQDTGLRSAEAEWRRLKDLAAAGAIAPARLRDAEAALADARDEDVLRRTLFARIAPEELSARQAEEMTSAAENLVLRQSERVARQKKLVEDGVAGAASVGEVEEEWTRRKQIRALALDRARLMEEITRVAAAEAAAESTAAGERAAGFSPEVFAGVSEKFEGSGVTLSAQAIRDLTLAWEDEFGRPLPVSARGDTAVHRSLGFDHRGRLDVAVEPDSPEGKWLRAYLINRRISFFAFRAQVAGKATAPHIHVGPGSVRIRFAD